jgi:hypothetical protein
MNPLLSDRKKITLLFISTHADADPFSDAVQDLHLVA